MKRISEFLGKIRNIQARETAVRLAAQKALKEKTPLEIPLEAISCKGATVILKGIDQAARSAVFIRKEAIIKKINDLQTVRMIRDIR